MRPDGGCRRGKLGLDQQRRPMCLVREQIRFSPWGPELDVGTKVREAAGHRPHSGHSGQQRPRLWVRLLWPGVHGSAIVCLSVQPVSMSPAGASVHVPSVNLLESITQASGRPEVALTSVNSVTHSFLRPAGLSREGTNALSLLTWRTLGRCVGVWTRLRWREPVWMSTCQATGRSGLHGFWGAGGGGPGRGCFS